MAKSKDNLPKNDLVNEILNRYQPQTIDEMQDALKDMFGSMFETMLQGEMCNHLGYKNNEKEVKPNENRRSGYSNKTVKTAYSNIPVKVPRDVTLWMQIFDELKNRGVEEYLVLSMDGVSGLEEGAKSTVSVTCILTFCRLRN